MAASKLQVISPFEAQLHTEEGGGGVAELVCQGWGVGPILPTFLWMINSEMVNQYISNKSNF